MLHMKYNENFDSCQVPEKFKNSWIYDIFLPTTPMENHFTKKHILIHFAVPINIQLQYIYKYNTAYAQLLCLSLCLVPTLYEFSNVRTSIHVPQKYQYQPNSGPVSKDWPPKSRAHLFLPTLIFESKIENHHCAPSRYQDNFIIFISTCNSNNSLTLEQF